MTFTRIAAATLALTLAANANAQTLTPVRTTALTASGAGFTQPIGSPPNNTPGFGPLMPPVGWGYMDPMVVLMGQDEYAPLFFACPDSASTVDPNRACLYLTKNGVIVSDLLAMAAPPGGGAATQAYQPPMLFARPSTGSILAAFWSYTAAGAPLLQLYSITPAANPHWTLMATLTGATGTNFNYLGGAMGPSGEIVVAGYGSGAPGTERLAITKIVPPYTTWQPLQTVAQYSSVAFQPLYPHVAIKADGKVSILATLNNGEKCSENPPADPPYTAYKNIVHFLGDYGSPFTLTWSEAAGDVLTDPAGKGDNCYYNDTRFPLDHFYDADTGDFYSIILASDVTTRDPANKKASNANYTRKIYLYKNAARINNDLGALFSGYFGNSKNIDAMSMTKLDNGQFVLFANSRGPGQPPGAGTTWPYTSIGVTWSTNLTTFATPQYIATQFGAGHSIKVAQPDKNGASSVPDLVFFNSGDLYNPLNRNDDHQYVMRRYTLQ